jgi:signal transduction protein with GAF and PtsI domain
MNPPSPDVVLLMSQLADALGQAVRPSALQDELQRCVTAVRTVFEAAACSCAVLDGERDVLRFVAADGEGAEAIVGVELTLETGVAGWVALSGQAVMLDQVANDARFAPLVAAQTGYVPTRIMAAPLLDEAGTGLGVLEVLDPSDAAVSHGNAVEILEMSASLASAVVRLSAAYDALSDTLLGSLEGAQNSADFRSRLMTFTHAHNEDDAALARVAIAFHDLAHASPNASSLAQQLLSDINRFIGSP